MKIKMTFKDYLRKVNNYCERFVGLSKDDLVDYCYQDAYEDGVSASACAKRAIKNSGY